MTNMIRYLYEYRDGRRIRNVGFVKAEQDEAAGTLQIHGRATLLNSADIRVYLFFTNGEKCFGIPMGELHGMQSILNARLSYDREEIEKYTDFDAIRGLILDAGDQGTFAAVWDESVVPIEEMRLAPERTKLPFREEAGPETEPVWEAEPVEGPDVEAPEDTETAQEVGMPENVETAQEAEMPEDTETVQEAEVPEEVDAPQEAEIQENIETAADIKVLEEMDLEDGLPAGAPLSYDREAEMPEEPLCDTFSQKRDDSCQDIANALKAVKTMEPADAGMPAGADRMSVGAEKMPAGEERTRTAGKRPPVYRKISREDLRELPRRDRYLANNSFLLHGYYNYKHLMFIEDGEDFYLGVPGIYHPREALAAGSFGFPVFREISRQKSRTLNLSAQEINENEIFGYWCRRMKKNP